MRNNLLEEGVIGRDSPSFDEMNLLETKERDRAVIMNVLELFSDVLDKKYTGEDDNPDRVSLINEVLRPCVREAEFPLEALSEKIRKYINEVLDINISLRKDIYNNEEFVMYYTCYKNNHKRDRYPQEVIFRRYEMSEERFKKIKDAAVRFF